MNTSKHTNQLLDLIGEVHLGLKLALFFPLYTFFRLRSFGHAPSKSLQVVENNSILSPICPRRSSLFFNLFLLLFCWINGSQQTLWAQVTVEDSLSLVHIYEDTNGDDWNNNTGWLTQPVAQWYGINLTANKKNVQQIDLQNNNLTNDLPNIDYLPLLTHLYLQDNQLSGHLHDYTTLPALEVYNLGNNQLEAEIIDFQYFNNLEELHLYGNSFIGDIPNFNKLPNLNVLALQNNALVNAIPNFTNLPNLEELLLNDNFLTENIPNFNNLSQLRSLVATNNKLSGAVPNFSNTPNLQILQLNNNRLDNNLPNFSNIKNLQELYIGQNKLIGAIPNFNNLPQLQILHLHENELNSELPNFAQLPDLQELKLNNNELIGTIPDLDKCPNLQKLWLSINLFNGAVPNFSDFSQLQEVYLNNNYLTFAGLQQNIGQGWNSFIYAPQARIPIDTDTDTLQLSVSAGGTIDQNTYRWYRNGLLYQTIKGKDVLTLSEQGTYYCEVSNDICTNDNVDGQNLILVSEEIQVPDCQITIANIEVSACEPSSNTYMVEIDLDWRHLWGSSATVDLTFENETQSQSFDIDNIGVGQTVLTLTDLTANSAENVGISIVIGDNNQDGDCIASQIAAYDAPALCCASGCLVDILSVTPLNCNPTDNSYEVDVAVSWENAWYKSLIVKWFGTNNEERVDTFPVADIASGQTTFTLKDFVTNNETDLVVVAAIEVDSEGCTFNCASTRIYDAPDICGFTYVWPGDANNNGITTVHDLLPIGLGYGKTDLLRPNATLDWDGQPCRDWQSTFSNSDYLAQLNHKYADCDGNDSIHRADVRAISLNYDLTHLDDPITPTSPDGIVPLYWDIPDTIYYSNDTRRLAIHLGQTGLLAADVYGIAFKTKMTVPDDLQGNVSIPFSNMSVDFNNSWLGNDLNVLKLDTCIKEQNRWDIGMTRYNKTTRDGINEIAAFLDWKIEIDDIFRVYNYFPVQLRFEEVQVIDGQGNLLPIQAIDKTVYIRFQSGGGVCSTNSPMYPNPAREVLYLECPVILSGEYNVNIFDVLGRFVHRTNPKFLNGKLGVDVSSLAEGVYFFQFYTNRDKDTIIRKVVITR